MQADLQLETAGPVQTASCHPQLPDATKFDEKRDHQKCAGSAWKRNAAAQRRARLSPSTSAESS
eukprot:2160762-Amphidinium_carterae.1